MKLNRRPIKEILRDACSHMGPRSLAVWLNARNELLGMKTPNEVFAMSDTEADQFFDNFRRTAGPAT